MNGQKATNVQIAKRDSDWRQRLAKLAQKLGLAALTSLVCLVLLEAGFRVAGYKALHDIYSKPEIFWRHDPLLGWSMEPNTSGEYVGPRPFPVEFHTHVRINSMGLRGGEPNGLPANGLRVLVLGDSLVAGFEVEENETFEALLEKRLTEEMGVPIQVVNAGVRGYGTDQTLLFYRERGRALHPDVVVFNTAANDPEDNTTLHRARRPFGKAAFSLGANGSLSLVGSPVPEYPFCSGVRLDADFAPVRIDGPRERTICWIQTTLADHSALFTFATLRVQQNYALVYKLFRLGTPSEQATIISDPAGATNLTPAGKLTTALIMQIVALARQDGARFVLSTDEVDLRMLDRKALATSDIEQFDRKQIEYDSEFLRFKADSHFNPRGHARLAAFLAPVLLRNLKAASATRQRAPVEATAPPSPAPVPL
jgi:lysophospholipase L1-like esterase